MMNRQRGKYKSQNLIFSKGSGYMIRERTWNEISQEWRKLKFSLPHKVGKKGLSLWFQDDFVGFQETQDLHLDQILSYASYLKHFKVVKG